MTKEEKIICKDFLNDADKTHSCNEYKLLMALLEQKPNKSENPTSSIIDWNNCHTSEQLDSISTTKNNLAVDCIDRERLLKIYEDRYTELQRLKHLKDNKGAEDRQLGVNYCINILKEMPSVTPIRPKGYWITKSHGFPPEPTSVCSECGFDRDFYIRTRGFDKIKYCPNCGSRNEVEE